MENVQVLTGDSWSSVLLNNFDVGLGEAAMEPDLTSSTAFGFLTVGYFVFYYMFAQFVVRYNSVNGSFVRLQRISCRS